MLNDPSDFLSRFEGYVNQLANAIGLGQPAPHVLLLHGDTGSGKDSIARHLTERYGYIRMAFADEMRRHLEILNPIISSYDGVRVLSPASVASDIRLRDTVAALGWDTVKRSYPEARRLLQTYGTEIVRENFGQNYWADFIANQISRLSDRARVVVTDLRFESEWDAMQQFGPVCWWVDREENPHALTGDAAKHQSEAWHPPEGQYDLVVNPGTTLEELGQVVDDAHASLVYET